jgi:nucleotide-binding universal stress UspA family protein
MFQSILVPLDGSRFGEHALPFALSLARRTGAMVQLAHVHIPVVDASGIVVLDLDADQRARVHAEGYLADVARRLAAVASDVRVSTALIEGLPAQARHEPLAAAKADLFVLATHGRGPVSRAWLGSVTDALMRTASVPLLLIRPGDQAPNGLVAPPFRHMLIPLDGSSLAEQALAPALALGRLMEARYTLLRVVQPEVLVGYVWESAGPAGIDEARTQQLLDEAEAYLQQVAQRLQGQGVFVQTRAIAHPQPASAILEEADSQQADLIALATHGRGGIKRLLVGSIADKVVRGATHPVLVYRPAQQG